MSNKRVMFVTTLTFLHLINGDPYVCDSDKSCMNKSILSISDIDCYGYSTCSKSDLTCLNGTIECTGSKSCLGSPETISNFTTTSDKSIIHGKGTLSFAWSQTLIGSGYGRMGFYGEASAYEIQNITAFGTDVVCEGYRSCDSSIIYHGAKIYGFGSLSLRSAIIYSSNNYDLSIEFSGYYAGYNTTIYCQNYDTCSLTCYGNGCSNTYFICDNGASCSKMCSTTCPFSDTSTSLTPMASLEDYNININPNMTLTIDNYTNDLGSNSIFVTDIDSNNNNNNIECTKTCNDYKECSFESFSLNSDQVVCCHGDESCSDGIISTTSSSSTNTWIFCSGTLGFERGVADFIRNVYSSGHECLTHAKIHNFQSLIINSYSYETRISNGNYLACKAKYSCDMAQINGVSNIYATGYQSMLKATINTNGSNVNIYLLGYDAGKNLTIHCTNTGDECMLYCMNDGCTNIIHKDSTLENCCSIQYVYSSTAQPIETTTTNVIIDSTIHVQTTSNTQKNGDNNNNTGTLMYTTNSSTNHSSNFSYDHPTRPKIIVTKPVSVSIYSEIADNVTVNVGIIIGCLVISIIVCLISRRQHDKNHDLTVMKITREYSKMSELLSDSIANSNSNSTEMEFEMKSKFSTIEYSSNKNASYGSQSASHFIIFTVMFGMYDFYTDVLYISDLFGNQLFSVMIVFMISIFIEMIINICIMFEFFWNERNNRLFDVWFRKSMPYPIIFSMLSVFEIKIIGGIFISQIFAITAFYAPLLQTSISKIHQNLIYVLVFAHIPQMLIQFYVLLFIKNEVNFAVVIAMCVTIIDVVYCLLSFLAWKRIHRKNTIESKLIMLQNVDNNQE